MTFMGSHYDIMENVEFDDTSQDYQSFFELDVFILQ